MAQEPMNAQLTKSQEAGQTRELLEPEYPSSKQKLVTWVLYIALALIAIAMGIFLKWSFQDENILKVNNEPFPVRTIRENPEANGVVILKIDFCKNIETEGDLRMSFVSKDREVFLPITKEKNPKGCTITEVPILIPENIEPGDYRIRFRVVYKLNPLKDNIADEFTSKQFHISPHLVDKAE